ncbi:glycosyltransferase family 4 protein [Olivibacter sp. LS-1]|uniref:glycosyltransferase family 4 protein n=1 Tax=Olivibacter sp. LS-1 TaxID=2592345 RepID=UPI0011EA7DEB|nr:glycosyltransferase family 1 protein [Olivibacter sp. LS-1]QEL00967.1 glycosyltransferase family 4 protein [Olivibacter sp. LS-1]
MRIGYDAKRAFHNKTGLGNYSRSLIDGMCRFYSENHYFLFNSKPSVLYKAEGLHVQEVLPSKGLAKKFSSLWRTFTLNSLAHQYNLDIYHGLSHELPFGSKKGKTKWVLTVHDLIFIRYPHYFKPIDRSIYTYKIKKACRKADKIVAISEQTKRDLMEFLGIAAQKIEVVYQSCHPQFSQTVDEEEKRAVQKKYQLPTTYLLQVGTIEARKNLLLTIRALDRIPTNIHLVVIGKETAYLQLIQHEIAKRNLQKRVLLLHSVPFDDLPAIYQMAHIFIYPSRFEGFGIPIIEALHSGIPVIAARGSCLEEAGGPNSRYVDPDDVEGMGSAINDINTNNVLRSTMIKEGNEYVQRFNPKNLAEDLFNLYKSI